MSVQKQKTSPKPKMTLKLSAIKQFFKPLINYRFRLDLIVLIVAVALIAPLLVTALKQDSLKTKSTNTPQQISLNPKDEISRDKLPPSSTTTQTKPATTTTTVPTTPPKIATPKPTVTSTPPAVVPSPSSNVSGLAPTTPSGGSGSNTTGGGNSNQTPTIPSYVSENWSGYMATTASYSGISGSWTVPDPTGPTGSQSADATWIGIGGVTTSDLIQVGSEDTVEPNGQVLSTAFYEMLPATSINITTMTVKPGDDLTATLTQTSSGQWTIYIDDLTDNQSFTLSVSYTSSNSSAEWIEEDPSYSVGHLIPLDDFGTAAFADCSTTVSGSSLTILGANPDSITMVNRDGGTEAKPYSLTNSGRNFVVSWESS